MLKINMIQVLVLTIFFASAVTPSPDLYWSMDNVVNKDLRPDIGDQALWSGDLNTLTGTPVVPGYDGNALRIDKSSVRIGTSSPTLARNCMFEPQSCNGGASISNWLYVREWPSTFLFGSTFTTNVFPLTGPGFAMYPHSNRVEYVAHVVFANQTRYIASISRDLIPLNTWTHVAMTWSPENGVKFYINGSEPSYATPSKIDTYSTTPSFYNLHFGSTKLSIDIDEMKVWYRELSPTEIHDVFQPPAVATTEAITTKGHTTKQTQSTTTVNPATTKSQTTEKPTTKSPTTKTTTTATTKSRTEFPPSTNFWTTETIIAVSVGVGIALLAFIISLIVCCLLCRRSKEKKRGTAV
uniref:Uncharacterized LOC100185399 n=1 Tax=Ciona intestinalis TaxID=7719 RepID=F6ZNY7_CIOIN